MRIDFSWKARREKPWSERCFPAGWVLLAGLCAGLPGCSHEQPKDTAPKSATADTALVAPYPRGNWRLVELEELNRTIVWVSHIVIGYADSKPMDTKLRRATWAPDPTPVSKRSRSEALTLAMKVAKEAVASPDKFEELAKTYSDDVVTKAQGGSLGGVAAGQLPPQFLDGLAVMKPGEVSRIIETPFGYHILKRGAVPPDVPVSGRRFVIGYTKSTTPSSRSRDDAASLAADLSRRALAGPNAFGDMIAKYSEAPDRQQGGDIGLYSLRAPEFRGAEVERLGALADGAVAEPLETLEGFVVLQRTQATPRMSYAMVALKFSFDRAAPTGERSRAAAGHEAALFAKEIAGSIAAFQTALAEHCCREPIKWREGRGPVGVTPALAQLAIGSVATQAVESFTDDAFLIVERLDPKDVPDPQPTVYEIPNSKGPDIEDLVGSTDGATLASNARTLGDELPGTLDLPDGQRDALKQIIVKMSNGFAGAPDVQQSKLAVWRASIADAEKLLGSARFLQFRSALDAWVLRRMLEGRP